jgi:Subtilase family
MSRPFAAWAGLVAALVAALTLAGAGSAAPPAAPPAAAPVTRSLLDLAPARSLAFANTEPDATREWYLPQDHAWDFWPSLPTLTPIRVAVIDSGIDAGHPEFRGRILAGQSFVGGSWQRDNDGHGTFVAGEIAANPSNGQGIAGLAFNAQLLIAKVVRPDGSVSLTGEVAAIHWAVAHGARVINLSLGGVRDPADPTLDSYSAIEQQAIGYAVAHGVLVVAALGNGAESPATPWDYADWPAALPHVVGVSALRKSGSVPEYSNRDPVDNDISAPGGPLFSTIPRNLLERGAPGCVDGKPYSDCGPAELRGAIGTSFSAPQVAAAAALVLGVRPSLSPDQVSWLLERSATDVDAATGCPNCPAGRDAYSGWGRLDVQRALTLLQDGVHLPVPDRYEPNDDTGDWAHPFGPPRTISASVDYWDDPVDVYAVKLFKGQRLFARLSPAASAAVRLTLWPPGTPRLGKLTPEQVGLPARTAASSGQQRLDFLAPVGGTYYLEANLLTKTRDPVSYRLSLATRRTGAR